MLLERKREVLKGRQTGENESYEIGTERKRSKWKQEGREDAKFVCSVRCEDECERCEVRKEDEERSGENETLSDVVRARERARETEGRT